MNSNAPKQSLSHLEKAIESLEQLHQRVSTETFMAAQDQVIRLGLQAGLIQNFEFTFELCWKSIKRWLENNINPETVDGITRRE
jgi:hypothetical protein